MHPSHYANIVWRFEAIDSKEKKASLTKRLSDSDFDELDKEMSLYTRCISVIKKLISEEILEHLPDNYNNWKLNISFYTEFSRFQSYIWSQNNVQAFLNSLKNISSYLKWTWYWVSWLDKRSFKIDKINTYESKIDLLAWKWVEIYEKIMDGYQGLEDKIKNIQSKINNIESKDGIINNIHASVTEMKWTITQLKDEYSSWIKSLQSDSKSYKKEIEDLIKWFNKKDSAYELLTEKTEAFTSKMNEKQSFFDKRINTLEWIIWKETAVSLFSSFNDRAKILNKSVKIRWWILWWVTFLAIWYAAFIVYQFPIVWDTWWWIIIVANLLRISPVFFIERFVITQYKKERDLQEEYSFKWAVALTVDAYKWLISDESKKDEHILNSTSWIYKSPVEEISKIEQSLLTKIVDKIPSYLQLKWKDEL